MKKKFITRAENPPDEGGTEPSLSDLPTIFGCDPLFDVCVDGALMSLSFEGTSPFLDWLGWEGTKICVIKRAFISFVRSDAGEGRTGSAGWLANPCDDPNSVEFDTCDFTLTDFARLRRAGPNRDITKFDIQYCAQQPRYRLDGTPINDQLEYDMRLATEVILQDLKTMVINGNSGTEGQFDGLEQLVKTGYTNSDGNSCSLMDSIIIDWNGSALDESESATWNGVAIENDLNFLNVLQAVYRRIRHRIRMSPSLAAQNMTPGDMILVLPEDFASCILDLFTCWMVCDNDVNLLSSLDARRFRDSLNGGMFGMGEITMDGFRIPLMPYDWGLINGGNDFDAYLLTGSVGNMKLIQGQYNDMGTIAAKRSDRYSTDGGRLLTWLVDDETCEEQHVEMQPRMLMWAPWAQVRFEDLVCNLPGGPMSSDPWNTYFPYP